MSLFQRLAPLCLAFCGSVYAATISTVDFTPISGSWTDFVNTGTPIQINLGSGYGTATVSYKLGGQDPLVNYGGVINHSPGYSYNLANGDTLFYNHELVIGFGQSPAGNTTDATMSITIRLDDPNAVLPLGTYFVAYSLDRLNESVRNGFVPGAQLGNPDPVNTYTDGNPLNALIWDGTAYVAQQNGISVGHPFPLLAPSNSLTFGLIGNIRQQGIGFALAVPDNPVPEPGTVGLVLCGAAVLFWRQKRTKNAQI